MGGNANAARLYLGGKGGNRVPKPNKNAGVETIEKYIRAKYEHGQWLNENFKLTPKTRPTKPGAPKTSKPTRAPEKLISALESSSWAPTPTATPVRPPPEAKAPVSAPVSADTDFFSMFDMKPTV